MTAEQSRLLPPGHIRTRQRGLTAVRVRIPQGDASAAQLAAVALAAERFGGGEVHLTVRQCVEIRGVDPAHAEALESALAEVGLAPALSGKCVRAPVVCPGAAVCPRGLLKTGSLARLLDERLYGRGPLPHKLKMAVSGCPSSCARPCSNDIGLGAAREADGRPAWRFYLGGKAGAEPELAIIAASGLDASRAVTLAERTVDLYAERGRARERLRDTMERVGVRSFVGEVLGDG